MGEDERALVERLARHGFSEAEDVLHFPAGGEVEAVRVQEGVVFSRRAGVWASAEPGIVMAWFADDSPAASWVRRRGADLLRLMLSRNAAPPPPTPGS